MSSASKTRELERLEAEYRARKATIRVDPAMSWEKKELAIRRLGDEYYRARTEIEKEDA